MQFLMKLMPPYSMIVFAVYGISAKLFKYSMFLLKSCLFYDDKIDSQLKEPYILH